MKIKYVLLLTINIVSLFFYLKISEAAHSAGACPSTSCVYDSATASCQQWTCSAQSETVSIKKLPFSYTPSPSIPADTCEDNMEVFYSNTIYTMPFSGNTYKQIPTSINHSYKSCSKVPCSPCSGGTPNQPTLNFGMACNAATGKVDVTVTVMPSMGPAATSYEIIFNGIFKPSQTWTFTGADASTIYNVSGRACNSMGCSPYFNTTVTTSACAVPPPPKPAILTTSSTCDTITVNWSLVGLATSYTVQCGSQVKSATSSPVVFTGLTYNTPYLVSVKACNGASCSAETSNTTNTSNNPSCSVSCPLPQAVFTAPTGTLSGKSPILYKWNPVPGAEKYEVWFSYDPGSSCVGKNKWNTAIVTLPAATTSYSANVSGCNSIGCGAWATLTVKAISSACPTASFSDKKVQHWCN